MRELDDAIKNICLNHTNEDTRTSENLILLKMKEMELRTLLEKAEREIDSKDRLARLERMAQHKTAMLKMNYSEVDVEVDTDTGEGTNLIEITHQDNQEHNENPTNKENNE